MNHYSTHYEKNHYFPRSSFTITITTLITITYVHTQKRIEDFKKKKESYPHSTP